MNKSVQSFKFAVLIPQNLEQELTACIKQHVGSCNFKYRSDPSVESQDSVLKSDIPQLLTDPHIWYFVSLTGEITRDLLVSLIGSYIYNKYRESKLPDPSPSYIMPTRLPSGKLIRVRGTDPEILEEIRKAIEREL